MVKDNTLKKDAPAKENTPDEKVEKIIDIRKTLTPEEEIEKAKKRIALEEGENIESSESQESEKKEEAKEEKPKVELPERYKGKSAEELARMLEEKEKYIQGRSDEIGEWKKKVEESKELKEKVKKIEEDAIKESQQPSRLPKRPQAPVISDKEFYDDPAKAFDKQSKYNQELLDYVDQITSARTAPLYQTDVEKRRDKIYTELEEKYKDYPVKLDRVQIQEFLDNNPLYFTKYKTQAYEQAYHDLSAPYFSQKQKEERETMREQIKKEVLEEMKNQNQASNIGLGDLETQSINPTGSSPKYDVDRMEEDPEYRKKALADMEKRKR